MSARPFMFGERVCASTRRVLQLLGATVALFLISLSGFSQASQGTVQGAVFDQTGGVIPGAMVTVIDVARGVTRPLTTDNAGQYIAVNVTPGTYTVRAEAKGFRATEHNGVLVEVGQTIRVDLTLQPGEQTQTVTVTGEASVNRYYGRNFGRDGQQLFDQRSALEWPELPAPAPTPPWGLHGSWSRCRRCEY